MSIPKFNLSKLKEAVSNQQKATRQDIRNLLLLERLQADVLKQNQTKKSKSKSGEVYKVTINGLQLKLNNGNFDFDVEFTKYIGKKEWDNLTLKPHYIEEIQQSLNQQEDDLDWFYLGEDDYEEFEDGSKEVSQKYAEKYVNFTLKGYIIEALKVATLLNNLGYFEENYLLKDTNRNSWEITHDNGSEMFGNYDPKHWEHIDYNPYQSIQIERI